MARAPLSDRQAALAMTILAGELIDFFDRDWIDTGMANSAPGRAWAKRANAILEKAKSRHARALESEA